MFSIWYDGVGLQSQASGGRDRKIGLYSKALAGREEEGASHHLLPFPEPQLSSLSLASSPGFQVIK